MMCIQNSGKGFSEKHTLQFMKLRISLKSWGGMLSSFIFV